MRDLLTGLRYVGEGQRWVFRHGRWWGFGLLPALVTLVVYGLVLAALALWGPDLATWATPFADAWHQPWQGLLRGVFVFLLFALVLLLGVLAFTAVTLVIGDPFYERLSEAVEQTEGHCPQAPDRPWYRELWLGVTDAVHVLVRAGGFGLLFFVLGFLPVVGQSVVPAVGFCVSGFFLAAELTCVAMQRRGIPVRERLRLLRGRRMLAVGFGTPYVLAFLVPFVAVVLMPGAVAGAALLVRAVVGAGEPGAPGEGRGEGGAPAPAAAAGPPPGTPYACPAPPPVHAPVTESPRWPPKQGPSGPR